MVEARWISFADVEPAREYLALITYLPRKRYWSTFSFIRQSNPVQKQLKGLRGLIGYSLRAQLLGKKAWSVSVWEDERALIEFFGKSPHADTMKNVGLGAERKFARWTPLGSDIQPHRLDAP